jgi:hypothetical protein
LFCFIVVVVLGVQGDTIQRPAVSFEGGQGDPCANIIASKNATINGGFLFEDASSEYLGGAFCLCVHIVFIGLCLCFRLVIE